MAQPRAARQARYSASASAVNRRGADPWTDDELIEGLRRLYRAHGRVCTRLINEDPGLPSVGSFAKQFGSLRRAYELAGLPSSLSEIQAAVTVRKGRSPWPTYPRPDGVGPSRSMPSEAILDRLRAILQAHGCLSQQLIDDDPQTPSSATVRKRFGSLARACRLAGWTMDPAVVSAEMYKRRCQRFNAWMRGGDADLAAAPGARQAERSTP